MVSVLATVDGSPESAAVIPAIEKLAAGGSITLLTVVTPPSGTRRRQTNAAPGRGYAHSEETLGMEPPMPPRPPEEWIETRGQAIDRVEDEGRHFLELIAEPLQARGFQVEIDVVVDRDPVKAIASYARRTRPDLIAMATHGRSGLRDLVHGSVASAVVRSGVAPVLLVRPSKAQQKAYRTAAGKATRATRQAQPKA